ncbi:hypothetical protein M8J75_000460 [Diaphorina citri]|nr:hypothetical protein M8J75_000460 [Diaphorina citri]
MRCIVSSSIEFLEKLKLKEFSGVGETEFASSPTSPSETRDFVSSPVSMKKDVQWPVALKRSNMERVNKNNRKSFEPSTHTEERTRALSQVARTNYQIRRRISTTIGPIVLNS